MSKLKRLWIGALRFGSLMAIVCWLVAPLAWIVFELDARGYLTETTFGIIVIGSILAAACWFAGGEAEWFPRKNDDGR